MLMELYHNNSLVTYFSGILISKQMHYPPYSLFCYGSKTKFHGKIRQFMELFLQNIYGSDVNNLASVFDR